MASAIGLVPFISELSDAQPLVWSVLSAAAGYSAARYTAFAQLNKTLLDASRKLVEDAQTLHARDGARITELEGEILRQRGEIANHIQQEHSLRRLAERLQERVDAKLPR